MSETLYKVVFTGELMPGQSLETVKSNLAKLFKSDLGKIDSLFSGRPTTLKRELSESDADKYLLALRNAGAMVRKETDFASSLSLVEHEDSSATTTHADAVTKARMACPKCGHDQIKASECEACGIIVEKFIARQALQAATATFSAPTVTASLPDANPNTSSSPYSPPQSSIAEEMPEYSELKVLTTNGRIGRLRYLAWSLSLILALTAAVILVAIGYALTPAIGYLLGAVALAGAMIVGVQIGVQRLHDIGWSGWLYLLILVPYLGSVFSLVIMAWPGSAGSNRFGAPAPENTTAVKILAGLWILVPLLGILAAVALPAYQDYLQRASS